VKWPEDDIDMVMQVLNHDGYKILMRRLDELEQADRSKLEHPKTDHDHTQFLRGRLSLAGLMRPESIVTQIRDRRGGADA
jgi:hypothetical protein